jgi:hypothetical protein
LKTAFLWDAAPYSVAGIDQRFRGAYCLHHQLDLESFSATLFQLLEPCRAEDFRKSEGTGKRDEPALQLNSCVQMIRPVIESRV